MIARTKVEAVKEYLKSEFPGFEIDDADDFERVSRMFRASNDRSTYIVKFERRFLDDSRDVKEALKYMELSESMKRHEHKQVLVTKQGVMVF
jgi:hypothetical protein